MDITWMACPSTPAVCYPCVPHSQLPRSNRRAYFPYSSRVTANYSDGAHPSATIVLLWHWQSCMRATMAQIKNLPTIAHKIPSSHSRSIETTPGLLSLLHDGKRRGIATFRWLIGSIFCITSVQFFVVRIKMRCYARKEGKKEEIKNKSKRKKTGTKLIR